MPTCNIDAKGKRFRLLSGWVISILSLILLVICLVWDAEQTPWWLWAIILGALASGGFQIYEGWAGWCAVRAMGFKTPF